MIFGPIIPVRATMAAIPGRTFAFANDDVSGRARWRCHDNLRLRHHHWSRSADRRWHVNGRGNYLRGGDDDRRRAIVMRVADGDSDGETSCICLPFSRADDQESQCRWDDQFFHILPYLISFFLPTPVRVVGSSTWVQRLYSVAPIVFEFNEL